ncbi:MAG: T9SS type A sorting domain-containing protein [Bacteroidota bacterium]
MPLATNRALRCALLLTVLAVSVPTLLAQDHVLDFAAAAPHGHKHAPGQLCVLPAAPFEGTLSIPAPERALKARGEKATATFNVDFMASGTTLFGAYACASWPTDAQTAFQYAADVWGGLINSPEDITVKACWTTSLSSGTLGAAGARSYYRNFTNAPYTNTWYPVALANALSETDRNGAGSEEIYAVFNGNRTDWYYGTDASPAFAQYDFVTVVMHEIGHGLGFAGSAGINNGTGRCSSAPAGQGCINNGSTIPYAFDRYAYDGSGTSLLTTATYANPSGDLATILTGGTVGSSTGVFFTGSTIGTQRLYTPSSYAGGSSYSHFDLSLYPSELMKPSLPNGQAVHDPGLALDLLEDLGWASVVPVELVAFDVSRAGEDVILNWATASETNNSGFEVQVRTPGAADFALLDFVQGRGTTAEAQAYSFRTATLTPGTYAFRLRQVDFDGGFEVFPAVEVTVEVVGTHWAASAYPNPFAGTATLAFAVQEAEPVRAVLYDLLGRAVQTVYEGTPTANTPVEVQVNGQGLASGTYVIEIAGERFRETQRVTVVR